MINVLITGAGSYVGTHVEKWLLKKPQNYRVDTVDTMNDVWRKVDFSIYDVVFHVAGIAHVDPKPKMAPLYYKVNRDLAIEVAKQAKECGVKQFIYMSSKIVYHTSKSLKGNVITINTEPLPNDFYGDSKLQAENGLKKLQCNDFNVAIIRPPMIYGNKSKGNFVKLRWLANKTPIFPEWHNKRSMLYIDNLSEFVRQLIDRRLSGTFYPQNKELVDTVEVVRIFAQQQGKKIWFSRLFNPFVWIGAFFLKPIPKMFADSYYVAEMSQYDFDYQLVGFKESMEKFKL